MSASDIMVIDPMVTDLEGETRRLADGPPLARIELLGVPAWTVTRHGLARRLLVDPRLVKDIGQWARWQSGEVTREWPLIGMIDAGRSMFTVDGAEHRRLRIKTNKALSPRRLEAIQPRIEAIVAELLDELAARGEGVVDLKKALAYPLPLRVICELMGVNPADQPYLQRSYEAFFSMLTPQDERLRVIAELKEYYLRMVREKTARPADDLTSDLIHDQEPGVEPLREEEVAGNLEALVAAGHETTVSLILCAVRALASNPDQLARARAGELAWEAVTEETLRTEAPATHLLMRFATDDLDIDGVVIEKGEGVVMSYRAIGRDAEVFGENAHAYDAGRADANRHIAFGHGPHICPGAGLARLEMRILLPALFDRFPDLTLAVPAEEIRNLPVLTQNDLAALPVTLAGS